MSLPVLTAAVKNVRKVMQVRKQIIPVYHRKIIKEVEEKGEEVGLVVGKCCHMIHDSFHFVQNRILTNRPQTHDSNSNQAAFKRRCFVNANDFPKETRLLSVISHHDVCYKLLRKCYFANTC